MSTLTDNRASSPQRLVGPLSPSEVEKFLKEYDEGKHPLRPEDEKALERSRDDLARRIREILSKRPNDSSSPTP